MAVRASRELVFDAPPEAIIDVLADIDALPSWSPLHREAEVLDRYPDGKPHHVRTSLRLMGIADTEVLEYHWNANWVVWDAQDTLYQRGQHGEYNFIRELDRTRVRFDMIIDPAAPVPGFLVKRAKKIVLDVAMDRLRRRVKSRTS